MSIPRISKIIKPAAILEDIFGDLIQHCNCEECSKYPCGIYNVVGTKYYVQKRFGGRLRCWIVCPWAGEREWDPIQLEDYLSELPEGFQSKFLFHINVLLKGD
jgi:hypothetical protein